MFTFDDKWFSHLPYASQHALHFAAQGAVVIPLAADSKRPALKSWGQFQHIRPSKRQLAQWFVQNTPSAYGLICGRISGIITLDFDEKIQYERFTGLFPKLLNTLIVQTGGRGGYHLYFRVDYPVKSQRLQGGDLQAEGKYVVGAGSVINGKCWQVIHQPPALHCLTKDELTAIISAFGLSTPQGAMAVVSSASHADFAAAYRDGVGATGERNNTLFQVTCKMRNAGCSVNETIATLAKLHTQMPPQRGQRQESSQQRYREALATIHSAYTAPPMIADDGKTSRLPNRLREAILAFPSGTAFLRVYEGLLLHGISGLVSRQIMIDTLKGIVGRHSIDVALDLTDTANQRFFTPLESPAHADTKTKQEKSNTYKGKTTALLSGKNRTLFYHIPSIEALCEQLNVINHSGEILTLDDLKSAKRYRMALHDAFIRRRPGQHTQALLASRVGRKTRTIRTYGKALGHQIKPTITHKRIDFNGLGYLPYIQDGEGKPVWGRYLQDENGKRYKPYREIAARLLKTGRALKLCTLGASIYAAKGVDLNTVLYGLTFKHRVCTVNKADMTYHAPTEIRASITYLPHTQPANLTKDFSSPPLRSLRLGDSTFAINNDTKSTQVPASLSQPSKPKYANALPNSHDEAAAYRLHTTFDMIPLSSARWIIERCGRERALQLMHRVQTMEIKDAKAYLVKVAKNAADIAPASLKPEQSARRQQKNQAIENAAQRLHRTIERISLVNARELVLTYGIEAVEATLRHINYISSPERQQPYAIRNAAGFFMSHIRQAWRRLHNAQDFSKPAPKFKPHKPRKRKIKYDPKQEFMRMARRGKTINWSYLEWRYQFWQALGKPDPYFELYSAWFTKAGRLLPNIHLLF